jgi:hypothetical protein
MFLRKKVKGVIDSANKNGEVKPKIARGGI